MNYDLGLSAQIQLSEIIWLAICYLTVRRLIRFHKTLLVCSQKFAKFSNKLLYKFQNEFELFNQSVKWNWNMLNNPYKKVTVNEKSSNKIAAAKYLMVSIMIKHNSD